LYCIICKEKLLGFIAGKSLRNTWGIFFGLEHKWTQVENPGKGVVQIFAKSLKGQGSPEKIARGAYFGFSCISINKFLRGGPMLCPPCMHLWFGGLDKKNIRYQSRLRPRLIFMKRSKPIFEPVNHLRSRWLLIPNYIEWESILASTVETFMPTHFSSRFAFESCTTKISESFLKKNFSSSLLICFVPIFLRQLSFKLFACEFLN